MRHLTQLPRYTGVIFIHTNEHLLSQTGENFRDKVKNKEIKTSITGVEQNEQLTVLLSNEAEEIFPHGQTYRFW